MVFLTKAVSVLSVEAMQNYVLITIYALHK